MKDKIYICIDLKSFYASVECKERNLDPLNTNLVVGDKTRTEKTVCLAVTPSLKSYGIGGRARLYEVIEKVKKINYERLKNNNFNKFSGKSFIDSELKKDKSLELDFIVAPPRMKLYMKYSSNIYEIYLRYFSKEDIFVYSIDEVFIDVTPYLTLYNMTPRELLTKVITEVYNETGITATGGIGTNLFLAKVAMDVLAKKMKPNSFGVRIAGLDEEAFRKYMWGHKPLTDIWRIGSRTEKKLNMYGMYTLGDVARMSIKDEELLYKLFGINAELLIDHAWGWEPVTIKDIKNYKPINTSVCVGQVLHKAYSFSEANIIIKEMADSLAFELVNRGVATKQLVLTINYDISNLTNSLISTKYDGNVSKDSYGRSVPSHSHGTINLDNYSASSNTLIKYLLELYNRIANPILLIRKISITANKLMYLDYVNLDANIQFDLFTDEEDKIREALTIKENEIKDVCLEKTMLNIKSKYGKNSIVKLMNKEENATGIERNMEVGGHHE